MGFLHFMKFMKYPRIDIYKLVMDLIPFLG